MLEHDVRKLWSAAIHRRFGLRRFMLLAAKSGDKSPYFKGPPIRGDDDAT
jgi:hypothetical protein